MIYLFAICKLLREKYPFVVMRQRFMLDYFPRKKVYYIWNILSYFLFFFILTLIIFKISDVPLRFYDRRLMKSHLYRNGAMLNAYVGGELR